MYCATSCNCCSGGGNGGIPNSYVAGGELVVNNGLNLGTWRNQDRCPLGSFAGGIQLNIEKSLGILEDDTSVNGVEINCFDVNSKQETAEKSSFAMDWGSWYPDRDCPTDYYVVAFQMKSEPDQGLFGDNTGTNGLRVKCRGPGLAGSYTRTITEEGVYWGTSKWGPWSATCPTGTAVCAIKSKVRGNDGGDDVALTDVQLYCCNAP